MKQQFRKLGHCNDDEASHIRILRIKIQIISFMLECAIKYDNNKQIEVCKLELELIKNAYEDCLLGIFERTGQYPGNGKVEIHRSGDVLEYFSEK